MPMATMFRSLGLIASVARPFDHGDGSVHGRADAIGRSSEAGCGTPPRQYPNTTGSMPRRRAVGEPWWSGRQRGWPCFWVSVGNRDELYATRAATRPWDQHAVHVATRRMMDGDDVGPSMEREPPKRPCRRLACRCSATAFPCRGAVQPSFVASRRSIYQSKAGRYVWQ